MDEEQHTQDFIGVSTPTFVTQDTKANAHLQKWSIKNAQIFHFVNLHAAAPARPDHAGPLDQDAEQPVRGAVLQLRAVSARRGPGDAVLGLADVARRARRFRGCRCVRPTTTCATPWSRRWRPDDVELDFRVQVQTDPHLHADREQRRALARAVVAAGVGGDAAAPAAALRLAGADGVRPSPVVQPLALRARAPAARQPEPGAAPHVLRAVAAPTRDERTCRTTSPPGTRRSSERAMTPQSQVYIAAPITPGQGAGAATAARLDERRARAGTRRQRRSFPFAAFERPALRTVAHRRRPDARRRARARRHAADAIRRRWRSLPRSTARPTRSSRRWPTARRRASARCSGAARASRRRRPGGMAARPSHPRGGRLRQLGRADGAAGARRGGPARGGAAAPAPRVADAVAGRRRPRPRQSCGS